MGTHGGARCLGILAANGVINVFMLAIDPLQITEPPFRRALRRVHPRARNDHGSQVGHQVFKVPVAGGAGNFQVKLEVRRHRIRVGMDGVLKRAQGSGHGFQVPTRASLGGEARRLGFQADAQFQYRNDIGYRSEIGGCDFEIAGIPVL